MDRTVALCFGCLIVIALIQHGMLWTLRWRVLTLERKTGHRWHGEAS